MLASTVIWGVTGVTVGVRVGVCRSLREAEDGAEEEEVAEEEEAGKEAEAEAEKISGGLS